MFGFIESSFRKHEDGNSSLQNRLKYAYAVCTLYRVAAIDRDDCISVNKTEQWYSGHFNLSQYSYRLPDGFNNYRCIYVCNMVSYENVLLGFFVWRFIKIAVIDADQEKPDVGPEAANTEDKVASLDLAKKKRKEYNRYYNDHQRHKYDKGIQTIEYPDRRQQEFHVTK